MEDMCTDTLGEKSVEEREYVHVLETYQDQISNV